ncbi:hypothetical protein [uncultured Mycolicibacterium sp.]|uniref:hypothetical protein n=1 Tax=uncultured Mycolicibacterium sp. TaxID=2320817 RepID=UPI002631DE3C|nr:hypothetical protein [uncultured Mycolicibacterium sp.]
MTIVRAAALAALALLGATGTAQAQPYDRLDPVPVQASPACGGTATAEAQVTPVQVGDRVADGVRVVIRYDAGVYDGSCVLTVPATWENRDTGAAGAGEITAVSTVDGHYGFIGYANTTFVTGPGTVVVGVGSHPGQRMVVTPTRG